MNDPVLHTDVLVIGGGCAGIAAAVGAVSKGLDVVLIERNAFLGGKATAAEVGTICGLYKFSKEPAPEFIARGFARMFAEELQTRSNSFPLSNAKGLHYLPYNIEVFKKVAVEILYKNKVEFFLDTTLKAVETTGEEIRSVTIHKKGADQKIECRSVVDCSGEAMVSMLAGHPIISSESYQAAAQVFTLTGLAETSEAALDLILKRALQVAISCRQLENHFDRVYIVPGSLKSSTVSLKIGLPAIVQNSVESIAELEQSAKIMVTRLVDFLTTNLAVFKFARLLHIAPEVGIRITQRTAGKYTLSDDDVLSARKFANAIANASWPIEEWEQNKRVKMQYFALEDHYQVPADCLQAAATKNLFMAGRNISATNSAVASARVMGTCLQTGYAAGILAAGHVLNIPVAESIKAIQNHQI